MLSNIYKICDKYGLDYSEQKLNELPVFLMKKEEELIHTKKFDKLFCMNQ